MARVKSRSPSPPGGGGDEEFESFDLHTPDALRLVGSDTTLDNPRKRSSTAHSFSPSFKRIRTASSMARATSAASAASRASAASGASAASKKKTSQAKALSKPRVKAPKIIFGFDLGTTYTGIAYAYSVDAKKIDVMMSWDDTNNDNVKIPSAIKFDSQGDIWGIDAEHISDALRWFKLTLVNASDLSVGVRNSVHIQDARDALQALEMSPVKAISTYMKHVWKRCIEKLKVEEGEETVDTSQFHVVFTIPAIWPNYARKLMEQAVQQAGILKRRPAGRTSYDFVSEPEAAALATLSGIDGRHNIEVGDSFVIADCGGGTGDFICYMVTATDPMKVAELVKGKGDLCGEIFVEERFKALLVRKLQEYSEDAMARVSNDEIHGIISRKWRDEIRSQFTGAAKTWTIEVPYSLIDADQFDPNSRRPTINITSAEVEEVFRPIVEKIYSLVNRQIEDAVKKKGKAPKYVILVGGFGRCKYLHNYLKQRCHGVEILQRRGSEPWTAISRGAVIYGMTKLKIDTPLSVDVGSRIARASYGAVCEEIYDKNLHNPEEKKFDPVLQKSVAINVMKWHVVQVRRPKISTKIDHFLTFSLPDGQGQDMYEDRHPSFTFTKFLAEPPKKIETIIYMSLEEDPPARKDDTVSEIFKLTWDIQIDWESLPVFVNDQQKSFRKLEYDVEMKCSAGTTVFSISHGGYKQANKLVSLEVCETADI